MKTKQKKRDKHNKRKKLKGQLKNSFKKFLPKNKKIQQKSRGDKSSSLFSQEQIFFEGDFYDKKFSNEKITRKKWKKKNTFFWKKKLERKIFF